MTDIEILAALRHARLMLPCLNPWLVFDTLIPRCNCAACQLDHVIDEISRRIAASEKSRLA